MTVRDHLARVERRTRDHAVRLYHALLKPPPAWAVHDLTVFFHWIIPALAILHIILGFVSAHQAHNPVQRAMTRFLFAKAAFWGVVWLSFHVQDTVLWFSLDALVLTAVAATAVDLLIRLTNRYIFVRRGNERAAPL